VAELGFHLPSLIVFTVNFGILFAALYLIGYKRILAMLDQRSERIRDSLEEADQVRSEATQARQDLEAQLGESRKAGQQVLEEARQAAEATVKRNRKRRGLRLKSFSGGQGHRLNRNATRPLRRSGSSSQNWLSPLQSV